jgi:hypothetical protein
MNTELRAALTDAIRYWEPRRLIYNIVLIAVTVLGFFERWPQSLNSLSFDLAQGLFILAVLANVAYCAAYVADIPTQLSGFRDSWLRLRWLLLVVGLIFAAIIARFFSAGFFYSAG